ncbi:LCP family protein [Brevibacterium aurantiacum]|uniref:LCP family protein n=1 Tax=Brevibacterium aurantiacum TaxID=273384 RepID=UPI000F63CF9E|nr:LCP family protein [Brevibacterium aurantiacum]MDN6175835.1 LCP family protein [Brevibacterium sp.]AZL04622.1 transcriptional regulator [Brevibacterium aurantiacum]MDN6190138.1 LCP family protein [Brevibacterium sp.]MDN6192411.1 LCP family protein [Brevibacterium sp.]MDN6668435.1 LCP family protein [Brevibacterium sp.]
MAKLKKMVSAVGSIKDLNSARAAFDDVSRVLPDEATFPPEDIRPATTAARTLLLRITHAATAQETTSQGDVFAIIHVPAANDFAAVMALNPSAQIESGQSFATIADEGGWPVIVAMVEDVLGIRVDHVAELESAALGRVISELGGVPAYSRAAFSAGGTDFAEGTNHLDASTSGIFTSADPVDDAGQTRTRNQRATLRALIHALKTGGLAKDPNKGAAVLSHFASGIQRDAALTTLELGKIANSLRQLQADDIAVVTVPTNSRREDNGTVLVDFDPEATAALKGALAGNDLPDFFRYLVSLGY